MNAKLTEIYKLLTKAYGRRDKWWSESRDEIIIGSILTQNTNWTNVEKALANLRNQKLLDMKALAISKSSQIAELIRPSGYHNQKSQRLIEVSKAINSYSGALTMAELHPFLLSLKGIGPETADSILLYAYRLPIFVIDSYTIRIFSRLGLCSEKITYHKLQDWFMNHLDLDTDYFREYHALLITHAKTACLKKPKCEECPLAKMCPYEAKYNIF